MISRLRANFSGKSLGALADQGVVSVGNFATNVILARHLPTDEYGVFALVYGIVIVANTLHSSLVTGPLTVAAASVDRSEHRRYTMMSLVFTVALSLVSGIAVVGVAFWAGAPKVGFWAVFAMLFWQVQETLRRSLLLQFRFVEAISGDALSYIGQAGACWALSRAGLMSLQAVFIIVAVTSLIAAFVQFWEVGFAALHRLLLGNSALTFWNLGSWMLFTNILAAATQVLSWVLMGRYGPSAVATLQAATNILAATHPLLFGMANIVTPVVASCRDKTAAEAKRAGYAVANGFLFIAAIYLAIVVIFPSEVAQIFYGSGSPYVHIAVPVRLLGFAYALYFVAHASGSVLFGLGRTRDLFVAQAAASTCVIAVGVPLTLATGVVGAAGSMTVMHLLRTFITQRFVNRRTASQPISLSEWSISTKK